MAEMGSSFVMVKITHIYRYASLTQQVIVFQATSAIIFAGSFSSIFSGVNWIHAITISQVHRSATIIHLFGDMPLQFVICLRCTFCTYLDALGSKRSFRMVQTLFYPLIDRWGPHHLLPPSFCPSSPLSFLSPSMASMVASQPTLAAVLPRCATGRGVGGKCMWFSDENGAATPALEVPAGWASRQPRSHGRQCGSMAP